VQTLPRSCGKGFFLPASTLLALRSRCLLRRLPLHRVEWFDSLPSSPWMPPRGGVHGLLGDHRAPPSRNSFHEHTACGCVVRCWHDALTTPSLNNQGHFFYLDPTSCHHLVETLRPAPSSQGLAQATIRTREGGRSHAADRRTGDLRAAIHGGRLPLFDQKHCDSWDSWDGEKRKKHRENKRLSRNVGLPWTA
jgi:hypothetical protein